MKRLSMVVLVLVVGAALPALTWADESPLAAAARKEQERRAKLKGPERVITDDDLPNSGVSAPATGADAGEGATSGEAEPGEGEGKPANAADKADDDKQKEARRKAIQGEIDAQVERIRVVRKQIDDIDRELADRLTVSEGPRRAQLAQQRDEGTKFIADVEARLGELQAEAQKLGVTVTRPE